MAAVANSAEAHADMASTYAAEGAAAPTQAELDAFANTLSYSYGAPLELFSVDPVTGAQTVLADTSTTNLLAELPVPQTEANGVNLGLQLADGVQLGFSSTARLADVLYAVSVQQLQATSFVTDNYNLDMQWLDTVDQPLLNEAMSWSEQATALVNAPGGSSAYAQSFEDENNTAASEALKIAAEAPGSRQDMTVTIKNPYTGNPTQVTVYAAGGDKIHDFSGSAWQPFENALSTILNVTALATGQVYLVLAAAAIDAAQAGQDFSNGEDLQGILSAAQAVSAGITGAVGVGPNGSLPIASQIINAAAESVGGVYGIVQSAQNGNALGILAGALEAAAAGAAGIGLATGTNTAAISAALQEAATGTNLANDFDNGNLGEGLVDSLNLWLPEVAAANQAWVNGTGPTTQGVAASNVPAQQISQALTYEGDLPLVGLAVAENELLGDPVPVGTELSAQDAATLEAHLALVEGTPSSDEFLALNATVTVSGLGGQSTGSGQDIANSATVTLPSIDTNQGTIAPSFILAMSITGTLVVTPGPGSAQDFQGTTIVPSQTDPGNYYVNTQGAPGSGSGTEPSNGSGSGTPSGNGPPSSGTPDTASINLGNLLSQAMMAFIPSAYGATVTSTPSQAQLTARAAAQNVVNDPKVYAFLESITWSEGGAYNQLFLYPGEKTTTFSNYSTHPPAVTYDGTSYSAAGAYQILTGTWKNLGVQLGLSDFSPNTQDLMAAQILIDLHVVGLIDQGYISQAVNALGAQWKALPAVGNTARITMQQFQSQYYTYLQQGHP